MNLNSTKYIYFLGIGGIGMSALARYFKAIGKEVSGYDKTQTPLTDELVAEGIPVHFNEDEGLVKSNFESGKWTNDNLLVVYTPAVPKNHSEYVFLENRKVNIRKRSAVLGLLTEHSNTIAVAGTHGKTTTSSMITHLLLSGGVDCSAFLGGITKNYNTNLILSPTLRTSNSEHTPTIVVEADEYDRSFLTLFPKVAVITSLDPDHLDIYGTADEMIQSYSEFSNQVKENGTLIINKAIQHKLKTTKKYFTYSAKEQADFYAFNIKAEKGYFIFDVTTPTTTYKEVKIGLPGFHNVENAVAAIAVASLYAVDELPMRVALSSFQGAKRRFDYQLRNDKIVYIDDYAHHPEELKACINSVKAMYADKKITGIFQPHLFTRTRDFADGFAESLDLLDECWLLDIYPARELPIEGVTSQMLLDKMKSKNKSIVTKNNLVSEIEKRNTEVLLTLGAGDIDAFVEPLKNMLAVKYKL